jgi:rod shape determining protein RodA
MVALLVLVLIVGKEINGAKAWFSFGFFSFQPSEWAKFGTALAVASYLSFHKTTVTKANVFLISLSLFLGPALLILLQPDFGSSLVFFSFFILLYRRGMSPLYLMIGLSASAIFICSLMFSPNLVTVFLLCIGFAVLVAEWAGNIKSLLLIAGMFALAIFLTMQEELLFAGGCAGAGLLYYIIYHFRKGNYRIVTLVVPLLVLASLFSYTTSYVFENVLRPHQQDRVNVWLRPEKCDPRGSLYNLIQAKLAIGSGGLTGKGFLKGEMTKLNYVPEQSTDFIFTTIGEEQGFVGSLGVIVLFAILLIRCVNMAERANLEFIRNYGYAVTGILLVHFTFNIGMTMGLLPVVGIPLPFISKGGSSLLAFSIMLAVLIKMDVARYRSN